MRKLLWNLQETNGDTLVIASIAVDAMDGIYKKLFRHNLLSA